MKRPMKNAIRAVQAKSNNGKLVKLENRVATPWHKLLTLMSSLKQVNVSSSLTCINHTREASQGTSYVQQTVSGSLWRTGEQDVHDRKARNRCLRIKNGAVTLDFAMHYSKHVQ